MANILLAYKNVVDSCTLNDPRPFAAASPWVVGAGTTLPNLKDPRLGKLARTNGGGAISPNSTWFGFKLAAVAQASLAAASAHNVSQDAQVRLRAGLAFLDVDFCSDQEGDPHFAQTFSGATNGTRCNEFGIIQAGVTPRIDYDGAYYKNGFQSSGAQNVIWSQLNGLALTDGLTVILNAAAAYHRQAVTLFADSYTISGKVQLASGSGDFCFFLNDNSSEKAGATLTATAEWQDFTQTLVATTVSSGGLAGVKKLTDQGVLKFRELQLERSPVKTEYRKTTITGRRFRCKGLLKEPTRTNLCLQAAQFTVTWTTNLLTVTANTTTAPDGTLAADTLTNTATAGDCYVSQTMTNAGVTCHSAFVKKGSAARAKLRVLTAATAPTDDSVFFDLTTLTFSGATGAFVKVGFVPLNDGWFRLYAVKAAQTGQTTSTLRLMPSTAANASVNGETVIVWGGQTEAAESPSSYIPTTTATVTRAAEVGDARVASGSYVLLSELNQTEGTIYAEAEVPASSLIQSVTTTDLYRLKNSGGANFISTRFLTDPASPTVDAISSTSVDTANVAIAGDTAFKTALRYRTNDWALYKDGASVGTDTTHSVPTPLDFSLDLWNTVNVPIWLKRITVWRTGFTNTQLAALTVSGPGAVDYDSGWVPAARLALEQAVADTAWGAKHDLQFAFPAARPVEFGVLQVFDPYNGNGFITMGRLFLGGANFQPGINASYGMQDSLDELSDQTRAANGALWTLVKDRPKRVAYDFSTLVGTEADKLHEMFAFAGIAEEVYYLPDSADLVASQRYGFLGQLAKVNPIQIPRLAGKANAIEIRQKK